MSSECWKPAHDGKCCCNCKYRLKLHYCGCGNPKCTSGSKEHAKFEYVCLAFWPGERLACAWDAHGLCEVYEEMTIGQFNHETNEEPEE